MDPAFLFLLLFFIPLSGGEDYYSYAATRGFAGGAPRRVALARITTVTPQHVASPEERLAASRCPPSAAAAESDSRICPSPSGTQSTACRPASRLFSPSPRSSSPAARYRPYLCCRSASSARQSGRSPGTTSGTRQALTKRMRMHVCASPSRARSGPAAAPRSSATWRKVCAHRSSKGSARP